MSRGGGGGNSTPSLRDGSTSSRRSIASEIASQASAQSTSTIDAEKAARHVELMQEGCMVKKKPAGLKGRKDAPLQERQLRLSSDLKRRPTCPKKKILASSHLSPCALA